MTAQQASPQEVFLFKDNSVIIDERYAKSPKTIQVTTADGSIILIDIVAEKIYVQRPDGGKGVVTLKPVKATVKK